MYSQANVRAGKVRRLPIRALPSVIVDIEKVLREADGPEESDSTKKSASGACATKLSQCARRGSRSISDTW